MMNKEERNTMTKLEWGVVFSVMASASSIIFSAGYLYSKLEDNTRRIEVQERKMDDLAPRVERIDANVTFLAERAREDREELRR